jgi:HlyD family secretion protein
MTVPFKKYLWWVISAAVAVAVLVIIFGFKGNNAPKYYTAKAEKGDISQVVEATGTISAVTTVQVGSQVSGTIYRLYADFNSHVKAGQVIAEIEPSLFQGALLQAKADLETARANVVAAQANLEKAKATEVQTKADYDRAVGLAKNGVFSQQQLDQARANHDTAVAAVNAAAADVKQAGAQVSQKQAAVTVAQTNLDHCTIRSPIDGTVVSRNVDIGQTVAASLQAPTLFQIAQDLTKMQVYVATDESDVGSMRVGQPATFKVDAFPKDTFTGRVSQIRLNATTVQNVVTYTTVVDFDNPQLKLFPGMTAYVTIPVAQAKDVVKIPNGALRFKPDLPRDQLIALYKAAGFQPPQTSGQGTGGEARKGNFGGGGETPGGGTRPGGATSAVPREKPSDVVVVWKLVNGKDLQPVRVKIGITDHTTTELVQVLAGSGINEGDELITGQASSRSGSQAMPGVGGPRR